MKFGLLSYFMAAPTRLVKKAKANEEELHFFEACLATPARMWSQILDAASSAQRERSNVEGTVDMMHR
jgi:hypothetical protein